MVIVVVVVVVTMLALYSLDLSLNGPSRFKGIKYSYKKVSNDLDNPFQN